MMIYQTYQLYQAERQKTTAELRRADVELGMRAAEARQLRRELTTPLRALRSYLRAARSGSRSQAPGAAVDLAVDSGGNGVCPRPVASARPQSSAAGPGKHRRVDVAQASRC